ncbi:hypothetical protein AMR47_20515 [Leptospira interrogans]|nr:hypothetical protein AMR47_00650 [Leptospira interrogans]ASP43190.1 hypothetical protein AMR47_20515 [Leptospira interrogans]
MGIRTLDLKNGKGNIGIGSGITWDSDPENEWLEILEKAKFFTQASNNFSLFETILYKNGIFFFQKEHLKRIKNSAKSYGFPFTEHERITSLKNVTTICISSNTYRVKISLNYLGKFTLEFQTLENFPKKGTLKICNTLMNSSSEFRKHKTNLREIYDREGKRSREAGHLDILF